MAQGNRSAGLGSYSLLVGGYHPRLTEDALDGAVEMTGLVAAAVLANAADLMTYLRASPAVVVAQETSPLPHVLGQVAGGVTAKLVELAAIVVIVVAFRQRPRTRAALLVVYTTFGVLGAVVNSLVA